MRSATPLSCLCVLPLTWQHCTEPMLLEPQRPLCIPEDNDCLQKELCACASVRVWRRVRVWLLVLLLAGAPLGLSPNDFVPAFVMTAGSWSRRQTGECLEFMLNSLQGCSQTATCSMCLLSGGRCPRSLHSCCIGWHKACTRAICCYPQTPRKNGAGAQSSELPEPLLSRFPCIMEEFPACH